jgi:hypothetical protein
MPAAGVYREESSDELRLCTELRVADWVRECAGTAGGVLLDCAIGGRVGDMGETGEFCSDELRVELRRWRFWSVDIAAAVRWR